MRKSHEIQIDGQQHQLDGHEQHNQILAVEKNADDSYRKQNCAQYQAMRQCHRFVSSAGAAASSTAGAACVACMETTTKRSAALART